MIISLLLPCLSYWLYLSTHLQLSLHHSAVIICVHISLHYIAFSALSLSCVPCSGWWVWRDTAGSEWGDHHPQLPSWVQQQCWLHLDCAGRARRHHRPGLLWLSAGERLWPARGQRHWWLFTVVSTQSLALLSGEQAEVGTVWEGESAGIPAADRHFYRIRLLACWSMVGSGWVLTRFIWP